MCAAIQRRRLIRLAILTVAGATVVSLAACSSSSNENTAKPGTSASLRPKPPPAPPVGHDEIEGLVRSVSGNTIQLTQRNRTAAEADFTPSTMITELGPARLTDVTPGACVDVATAAQGGPPGKPVTAQSVTISPSEGGKCPPPAPPEPGSGGGSVESPPVFGTVDSLTGNTIAISSTDPTGKSTHATVNVTDASTYNKHAVTNAQAIQNGKCLAAQGSKDGAVLHAATIDLEPCPPMGRPHHHHFHIPHLPHFHHH